MVTNLAEDVFSVGGSPPQNADWADHKYFPEVMYHDIRANYDISDDWAAYLGVDNVTDKIPPLGLTGTGEGSGIYDVRARYYYAGFKVNF
jgi:outer membrane receptor protein involved in Fe transport